MKPVDAIVLAFVLGGLWFMLYRTMWKKKTFCPGCATGCGLAPRPGRCLPQQGPRSRGGRSLRT